MSIINIAKGLSLSRDKPGVPKLMLVNSKGIPSSHIAACYYLMDGTVGGHPTTFADDLGAHNATIVLGAAPTRQTFGQQIVDIDGLVLNSGILCPPEGAVFAAFRHTIDLSVVQYPTFAALSINGFPATQGGSFAGAGAPYPQYRVASAADDQDTLGLLDHGGDQFGASVRPRIANTKGFGSSWGVYCWRWSDSKGLTDICNLYVTRPATRDEPPYIKQPSTGTAIGNLGYNGILHPNMIGYWSSGSRPASYIYFGLWPLGLLRPLTGELGAFIICNAFPDEDERNAIMLGLGAEMITRSVFPRGYPGVG